MPKQIRLSQSVISVDYVVVANNLDQFKSWIQKNGLQKEDFQNPDCIIPGFWESLQAATNAD